MKKLFLLVSSIMIMVLSGCSAVESKLDDAILERSGILEHDDYVKYLQYQEAGMLDENGQYMEPDTSDEESDIDMDGDIRVTFAENRYLEIWYFTDADMSAPVSGNFCYMVPGETLYAKVIESSNPNSNMYRLSEYRIVEYDAEGGVKEEHHQEETDGRFEYQIPTGFQGTEIAVIPVGECPDRNLSVAAYYMDDEGNERILGNAGVWSINDKKIEGNTAQVSPLEPYVLKFTYDAENYFYVGCEPGCFTKDPGTAGFVEFWEAEPTDKEIDYRVELHPFLTLTLKFSEEAQVRINQDKEETVKKNKEWNPGKLQFGDSITIETTGEVIVTNGNYQHISAVKDPITEGYRYTLKMIEEVQSNTADVLSLVLDVNRTFKVVLDSKGDHGVCRYELDGDAVTGEIQVKEDQKLTLTYEITDNDYVFKQKTEGIIGFVHDVFIHDKRTVTIPITAELDGMTIDPDGWFEIVEKGE